MPRTIVLKGEPRSTQHIYKIARFGGRSGIMMTAEGKAHKEDYGWQAKAQWHAKPLQGSIALDIQIFFKTRGKRDLDNFQKLSLDSMSGIVFEDDSQIDDLRIRRAHDPENPRIEIQVRAPS
jgi:crossover junction endodeoxyribonuclease RusA